MKIREASFDKGEVIFREGEQGDAVFVIESGRVELAKASPGGEPVAFAVLGPNELLGEMGSLDNLPHGATARALDACRLKVIPRGEFKAWLQQDPDAAMRLIAVLVERLRAADALIAGQGGAIAGMMRRPRLFDAMIAWVRRRRRRGAEEPLAPLEGQATPFRVGIATMNNDVDGAWTRALAGLLEDRSGIAVRVLGASLAGPAGSDQTQVGAAALRARQLLAREDTLDLLVWGDVHEQGYSLWFTAPGAADDERPGAFGPYFALELSPDFESPVQGLLHLAVLAAIEPASDVLRLQHRRLLLAAIEAMGDLPKSLPAVWSLGQQRGALTCWGHAMTALSTGDADIARCDAAVAAYRAAIQRLPRGEHGMDEAVLRRHLGGVLLAAGDKLQDAVRLEAAVAEFRIAVECLLKATYPQEWALAQNRLGQALYRLDLLTGRTELLKDALSAFHAALTVFTRGEAPQRWADVMNNLAQALQVYGDQMKSPEVLQRAVDACRAVLDLRSRERQPLAWAASQNTLGTALFLLDKHSQNAVHLDEAAAAFASVIEIFRAHGAVRQASVAEKNLAHARRLTKIRAERKVAMPDWAEE